MKVTRILGLCLAGLAPAGADAQTCNWGSFDSSRVNYVDGQLTGIAHSTFAGIIAANGGTVVAPTSTLTPAYLGTIDVFFTSLLKHTGGGALSAAEQSALQAWVAAGGTLVVTADYVSIPEYDTFTQVYGIGYTAHNTNQASASTTGAHPLISGVNVIDYAATVSISHGTDAQVLANDENGAPFAVVLEASTGFSGGGRVLIWGDHNALTDGLIGNNDNTAFANNVVQWACSGVTCPNDTAAWSNYGAGWPGTLGVPGLVAAANPVVGDPITINVQNSVGAPTSGFLLIGLGPASVPTGLGGTVLVNAVLVPSIPIPGVGLSIPGTIPLDPTLCGVSVHLQVIQVDPGASAGASFTPGLRLLLGS